MLPRFVLSAVAALPPGTRYLKIDVQHPAVVRHQKPPRESARHSQTQSQWPDREMQTGYPPSRLYVKLQRGLSSLEPVDVLASTARKANSLADSPEKRQASVACDSRSCCFRCSNSHCKRRCLCQAPFDPRQPLILKAR